MTDNKWTITPLHLATGMVDKSMTLRFRDMGVVKAGPVVGWLLQNGKDKILVDTGEFHPADALDSKGSFSRTPEMRMEKQLARFNTTPDEISIVINTHLHTDHAAGNAYFPKARFIVQKRELEYSRNPLYPDKPAYQANLEGINFELIEGDVEIAPGLKLIFTPGHTLGSQAVLVDTEAGLYVVAGDTVPHFENMEVPAGEPFIVTAIYVDMRELCASLERLRNIEGVILPGHDMLVLNKITYP
jgi:N-acyl homoserine lactone hydrolase